MPNRIILEKCRTSRTLDALSSEAERMFWRLVTVVDDYGRFDADPRVLLSTCFPLRVEEWKSDRMQVALDELARPCGRDEPLVELYTVNGRMYGHILKFVAYQRRRDSKPKFPGPTEGERIVPPQVAATRGEVPQHAAKCGDSPQVAASYVSESERRLRLRIRVREPRPVPQSAATILAQLRAFVVTAELRSWAQQEGIQNPEEYVEEWRDYWLSVGGIRKNGRPLKDLAATFRNSLRKLKQQGKLQVPGNWKDSFLAQEATA